MTGIGRAPGGAMATEDVGDLQERAAHRRRVIRPVVSVLCEQADPVERAHHGADRVGGDAGVERGRVKFGMPEQS